MFESSQAHHSTTSPEEAIMRLLFQTKPARLIAVSHLI
jgi:hypothetical protein